MATREKNQGQNFPHKHSEELEFTWVKITLLTKAGFNEFNLNLERSSLMLIPSNVNCAITAKRNSVLRSMQLCEMIEEITENSCSLDRPAGFTTLQLVIVDTTAAPALYIVGQ